MPLPLGCRRVDVPLKEKLELIPLKMPFFWELAGDSGAPFPHNHGSLPPLHPVEHASTRLWFPTAQSRGEPQVPQNTPCPFV